MPYKSRLPEIAAELAVRAELAAKAAAERVEQGAKDRVPVRTGKLRDAIHVDHERPGVYDVVAGDTDAFYGHIVEHGGAYTPAHPFIVPAAEQVRKELDAIGKAIFRRL